MDIFSRFSPYIQNFIYRHNWDELRAVQTAAAEVLFSTDDNLLLTANTASGKTEAAFFPALTLIDEHPSRSVGILYIGPLKALINDQFLRLDELCAEGGIPVWRWHGDVSQSRKESLLKRPSGILQITPESLEALLMRRSAAIPLLFSDLRFVIIDEVHALLRGERGGQTLCCLERLSRLANVTPRRIGLSATIGDPEATADFLAQGSGRKTTIPRIKEHHPTWRLSVECFWKPTSEKNPKDASLEDTHEDPGLNFIYEHTKGQKCLIFANSREECELVTATLRRYCETRHERDRFLIHHGNLSTDYRTMAEEAMRDEGELRSTVTTATLELGIDIGRLERVFQLDAPFSVSSFLQRLGRTGRRGNPPTMAFVLREDRPGEDERLETLLPWKLLQAIAIIQLYRESRWVEPPLRKKAPYSLLYHQTLSVLMAEGEMPPKELARRILTLHMFRQISQADYALLLRYLLQTDVLATTERGGLVVGDVGERQTNSFKFYAVFQESVEFTVRDDRQVLGKIAQAPAEGEKIAIAGRVWEVLEVDRKRRVILCRMVPGLVPAFFGLCPGDIHTRILERMGALLREASDFPYLGPHARQRLAWARELAAAYHMHESPLLPTGEEEWLLFPWLGTYAFLALERLLKNGISAKALGILSVSARRPFVLRFHMPKQSAPLFFRTLAELAKDIRPIELLGPKEVPVFEKFDEFLPPSLVRKGFAETVLDVQGMQERLYDWAKHSSVRPTLPNTPIV